MEKGESEKSRAVTEYSVLNYKCAARFRTQGSLCLQCGRLIDAIWHAGRARARWRITTASTQQNGSSGVNADYQASHGVLALFCASP